MNDNYIELPQPILLDFTKIKPDDDVVVIIYNTLHKFASDTRESGLNIPLYPIFGSEVYINKILYSKSTYGMPFIRFARNSTPKTSHFCTK